MKVQIRNDASQGQENLQLPALQGVDKSNLIYYIKLRRKLPTHLIDVPEFFCPLVYFILEYLVFTLQMEKFC